MRSIRLGLIVALFQLAPIGLVAGDEFPYTAYINSDDVYVRSGPGQDYYPTDKLQLGEAVEVYRHDPGGWLAIRPPQRSFSWVSSRYLRITDDGLAVVEGDRVVARVGTSFSDVRDVIQVRLERGEQVEVLDAARLGRGAEGQTWYKIAPPSGEFRWVYGKYVDRKEPGEPAEIASDDADAGEAVAHSSLSDEASRREISPGSREIRLTSGAEELDGAPGRVIEAGDASRKPNDWSGSDRPGTRIEQRTVAEEEEHPDKKELEAIDLALTVMVAEEPSVWSFVDLRRRTEAVIDRAETAVERGRARLLLNKLDRFENIKERYNNVAKARHETEQVNRQLDVAATAAATEAAETAEPLPKFEATGTLTNVISRRVGAPTFALVDERGEVQAFLTPEPGFSLQPYLGQKIGISGQRGFIPELKKPHITASAATVIKD